MEFLWWIVLLILVVGLVAAWPAWPHSRGWGYWGSALAATLLVLFGMLVLFGVIALSWPWLAAPT